MGKSRKNKRSKAAKLARRFAHVSSERYMDRIRDEEESRQRLSEHHRAIKKKEQEILETTVFVTQVRDLSQGSNLETLRHFFASNYGPIRSCERTTFKSRGKKRRHNRNVPARVRFLHKRDAEKIFGKELNKVTEPVSLTCPVGYKSGRILVRPLQFLDDMLASELSGSQITIRTEGMSVGHWYPARDEIMTTLSGRQGEEEENLWLDEVERSMSPVVVIDINKRTIELSHSRRGATEYLKFRSKELASPFELCIEERSEEYFLVFAVKHPPRLERLNILTVVDDGEHLQRSRAFGNFCAEDLARCTAYKLKVTAESVNGLLLHTNCKHLQSGGVLRHLASLCDATPAVFTKVGTDHRLSFNDRLSESRNLRCGILLKAIVDRGRFCTYRAVTDRVDRDGESKSIFDLVDDCRSEFAETVLDRLLHGQGVVTKYPCVLFQSLSAAVLKPMDALPSHCVSIPQVLLTPLCSRIMDFKVEASNRVVRKFTAIEPFRPEHFMRLQLTDESGQQLFGSDLTPEVEAWFNESLLYGISICGRQYEFLAYSSSQLKDCSVWMVHPPNGWSVARMRSELGDFSCCKTPSKYAARIGQCFSTTFCGTEGGLSGKATYGSLSHRVVPDIEGIAGSCHSDGTGMIRRDSVNRLLGRLPFAPKHNRDVSIIQIRYGGAKGTLSVWDNPEEYAHGRSEDVYLRKSMIKFEAKYADLEVCSVGKRVPYYLNRNVILLLSAHGVSDETFLDMQRSMLDDLDQMLLSREKALEVLPKLSGPDEYQKSMMLHMLHGHFSPRTEPFLFDCLHAIRSHHLFGLRKKARIFVEKGAVLMGGIDETGLLPEGAIFCQIQRTRRTSSGHTEEPYAPVVGPVMVTKHPVMHPGDVRMLLAVDIPELRGMRNVVLFSRHGNRPEADKMSGSDLDGDEFALCWDERLFIGDWCSCEKKGDGTFLSQRGEVISMKDEKNAIACLGRSNFAPMDFTNSTSQAQAENFSSLVEKGQLSSALVKHLMNHVRLASVGRICMLWLDYASMRGAMCAECLQLAELHSIAVDYPKSGIPAKIPDELRLEAGAPRAHWREKKGSVSFHCESIVGKLYDECIRRTLESIPEEAKIAVAGRQQDKYGTILCTVAHKSFTCLDDVYDKVLRTRIAPPRGHLSHMAQSFASQERKDYEAELLLLLKKHGIRGEGEVCTGCIRKYHKLHKKRQHEFAQDVRRQFGEMHRKYRKSFFLMVHRLVELDDSVPFGDGTGTPPNSTVGNTLSADEGESSDDDSFDDELEDALYFDDNDEDEEDDDVVSDKAASLEKIATTSTTSGDASYSARVRSVAAELAMAYYDVVYASERRHKQDRVALFSFPWLVADVVAVRMLHISQQETPE